MKDKQLRVRIYQPDQTATQSGRGRAFWILESQNPRYPCSEPFMGWVRGGAGSSQVRLTFPSQERAIAYAKQRDYAYAVEPRRGSAPKRKSYADNFRYGRPMPWTH